MRAIYLEDNLKIRFPGQDASFDTGVEIGMLATLMALQQPEFARQISASTIEQARTLGLKLGYHVAAVEDVSQDEVRVTFRDRRLAPKLKLVASNG
ncbi:hypothetical protein [Consotaella aegiceratis]|uniref:hypothetical protein n=1 Tax=Consotaella aegiceratis TaxID=3097961 RepID=UPI002F42B9C6